MRVLFIIRVFLFASISFVACKEQATTEQQPVARVFDKYLYQDDVKGLVPEGKSKEDSISIIKSYIDNWVREELILAQAEFNLPDEIELEIDKEVNSYRSSRIVYAYERELIREKLDTSVSAAEIEDYYNNNRKNFELKDYVVRGNYVKLEKNAPKLDKATKLFKSDDEEDQIELKDYCFQYATTFILDTAKWIYFKDLKKHLGSEIDNDVDFIEQTDLMEYEDDYYLHLLRIDEYIMKDSISPLPLEEDNIRNILLNQRKLNLIKTMHNQIYKNALSKGKFEIYLEEE